MLAVLLALNHADCPPAPLPRDGGGGGGGGEFGSAVAVKVLPPMFDNLSFLPARTPNTPTTPPPTAHTLCIALTGVVHAVLHTLAVYLLPVLVVLVRVLGV